MLSIASKLYLQQMGHNDFCDLTYGRVQCDRCVPWLWSCGLLR